MTSASIKTELKFLANQDAPLVYVPSKGGGDQTDHVGNFVMRGVDVHDARVSLPSSELDKEDLPSPPLVRPANRIFPICVLNADVASACCTAKKSTWHGAIQLNSLLRSREVYQYTNSCSCLFSCSVSHKP